MRAIDVAAASRPVTQLGARLLLTAGVLALVVGVYLLMRRGWRRRTAAQADLPPLPIPPPVDGAPLLDPLPGLYVGTTRTGDWLDRVTASGLSARARGRLLLTADGLVVERAGAAALFVPGPAIREARVEAAHAGKVVGPGGLLVVSWELGEGVLLDSGFRGDDHDRHDLWVRALRHLIGSGVAP